MNIPMKIRRRANGRWPSLTNLPGDKRATRPDAPRHAKRASGGLDKRRSANTKRGVTGGKSLSNRGRKRVITSARHGGPYGRAA